MDYSESYAGQECEMVIQSAYYRQNMVMLHPIVTYYKASDTEEIHHKSFVHVSPVDRHNTTGVIAILKKFHHEDIPRTLAEAQIFKNTLRDGQPHQPV